MANSISKEKNPVILVEDKVNNLEDNIANKTKSNINIKKLVKEVKPKEKNLKN